MLFKLTLSTECFRRLIQDIRLGNDTTEPEWDFRVPDGEEFRDDLREAARIGKRKATKVRLVFWS